MEHLTNCHGEWLYLTQFLAALPFVGSAVSVWVRARFAARAAAHTHENH